jgi:EAL domain-containing protein (putative c-di-GMP-specific phosphodiesterase class I)
MLKRPDCASIVKAVVGLAADLGMKATAEGVETEEQFAFLERLGCDEAQGCFVSRPAAAGGAPAPRLARAA